MDDEQIDEECDVTGTVMHTAAVPPAYERRALADHLAEALSRGAMHLALAAGELLALAHACAVLAAEAQALERVALRQAVPLFRDDPRRHRL